MIRAYLSGDIIKLYDTANTNHSHLDKSKDNNFYELPWNILFSLKHLQNSLVPFQATLVLLAVKKVRDDRTMRIIMAAASPEPANCVV